jgi:hypothetical protein
MPTPTRAPNLQALVLVVNGTFNILAALWIYADANARRGDKPLFAALAMLLLGPLWLAFYMTDRPQRPGERRPGGFGWNWTRNFTIAWTAGTAPWLGPAVFTLARTGAEAATRSASLLLAMWLVPIAIATGIGYLVRRPDSVDNPSDRAQAPAPARARLPLAAISACAVLLTFLILAAIFLRSA